MPAHINKRLGKNALVSTLLKNVLPVQRFKDAHPNDYRIRRGQFKVIDLIERMDGKQVVEVSHPEHEGYIFTILPGNLRLDRPGPPNQYFKQPEPPQEAQQQPQQQQAAEAPAEEEEDDVKPVNDGTENGPPPLPNHGWDWEAFLDEMATDWRGAAPKTNAAMNVGGMEVKEMTAAQFFDSFFLGVM